MTTTDRIPLPGFKSAVSDVRGARLHAWTRGDPRGPPVVLWHGFLATSYAWHRVAPRLAAAGLSVLVVGHERAFIEWFYDKATMTRSSIEPSTVDEYLRMFAGREGVLGAMGVYRAAFARTEQTEPLTRSKVRQPVIAIGGVKGLGAKVGTMANLVAENVEAVTLEHCGHLCPKSLRTTSSSAC
jgi:hypothetical protein